MVKYRVPVGTEDFKLLKNERGSHGEIFWYADKTSLIEEVINSSHSVSIITRPRRFGKTLNLSMLRYFFDTQQAKKNRELFHGLEISRNTYAMNHFQGQYPVIFFSLKDVEPIESSKSITPEEKSEATYQSAFEQFKLIMQNLYLEHEYLLEKLLSPSKKIKFEKILRKSSELTPEEWQGSLQFLITLIHDYHNKQVIVLVDEYDAPFILAFFNKIQPFYNFYRNFLGKALKGNNTIYKAVLTGIVQLTGGGFFSKLNHYVPSNLFTEQRYSTQFGFTESDVINVLRTMGRPNLIDKIKEWYNGYLFGNKVIYNPWSIVRCIEEGFKFDFYWTNTSNNSLLKKTLLNAENEVKEDLIVLMEEKEPEVQKFIEKEIPETLTLNDTALAKVDTFWALLLSGGYLKAKKLRLSKGNVLAEISIPNKEVYNIYSTLFNTWLREKMFYSSYDAWVNDLKRGNIKRFCKEFKRFFVTTVSAHDVRKDTIEAFYHGFVLALIGLMKMTHTSRLYSNRESGLGRFDIMFEPIMPDRDVGVIIELKRISPSQVRKKNIIQRQLLNAARQGLKQICESRYLVDLQCRDVKRAAIISFAFHGKQVEYVCKGPFNLQKINLEEAYNALLYESKTNEDFSGLPRRKNDYKVSRKRRLSYPTSTAEGRPRKYRKIEDSAEVARFVYSDEEEEKRS